MSSKKEVKYPVQEEILGSPSLFVDEISDKTKTTNALDSLSEYTGIENSKLQFFIKNYGLKEFLKGSDIFGLTEEQRDKLLDVKHLLEMGE